MDFKEENELVNENLELNKENGSEAEENKEEKSKAEQSVNTTLPPAIDGYTGTLYEKKYYIALTSLLVALFVLLTFVITYVVMSINHRKELDSLQNRYNAQVDYIGEFRSIIDMYNSLPEEMRNFETYEKLAYIDFYYRTNYAGVLDNDQLEYMVVNGYIMGAQDMYGGYYTADEFQTLLGDAEGDSVGIGVYVIADSNMENIRISYVMENGPAHKAGLLAGDIITHVGDKKVSELGYYGALDAIKGEPGTQVEITVNRDGNYIEKVLTREHFDVETIIYKKHETESDVGVIRILEFNNATTEQFINVVKKAVEVDGCTKLVFDVRGNPGGTLDSVLAILDFLLPKGVLTTQRFANGEKYEHSSDDWGEEFTSLYGDRNISMAVLVDGNTASAAELFTSALKDYDRAVIVGTKTFGKGCGQSVLPFSDGTGLVYTTFLYDPPSSPNYNGIGISPDIDVELSEEASKKNIFDLKHSEDNQLMAAVTALK